MRIKRLYLENFQSYSNDEVEFPDGTVFIRGDIGSGKSTLLRAIFSGLFQTNAKDVTPDIESLDELVRLGEESARIELTFEVDSVEYTIEWGLTVDVSESGNRSARTTTCKLTSPDFEEPEEGFSDVQERIQTDIVQMDAESFVNSVYVQQNDIRRLLTADTDERKRILDALLGLNKLDAYIERMENARGAASSIERQAQQAQETLRDQLRDKEDEEDLRQRKQEIATEIEEAREEVNKKEGTLEKWEDAKSALQEDIELYEEREDRRKEIEAQLEEEQNKQREFKKEIRRKQQKQNEKGDKIKRLRDEINGLDARLNEYDVGTAEAAEEAHDTVSEAELKAERQRTEKEAAVKTAQNKLDGLESDLKDEQEDLETAQAEIDEIESELNKARSNLEEQKEALSDELRHRNEATASFLDISEEEEVTDKTEAIVESRVEDLDTQREDIGTDIGKKETNIDNKQNRIDELQSELKEFEEKVADTEEEIERLHEQDLPTAEDRVETIEEKLDRQVKEASEIASEFGLSVSLDSLTTVRDEHIGEARSELASKNEQVVKAVSDASATIERIEERLEDYDHLKKDEACPLCGQDVPDDHSHEDRRGELREQLQQAREERKEANQREETLSEKESRLGQLDDEIREAIRIRDGELTESREQVEEIEQDIEDLEKEIDELKREQEDTQDKIDELRSEKSDLKKEVETLRKKQASLKEQVETGTNVLDAYETVDEIRDAVKEIETSVERKQEDLNGAIAEKEQQEQNIEEIQENIEEQKTRISEKQNELEEAEEYRKQVSNQKSFIEKAQEKYETIADLERDMNSLQEDIEHAKERWDDVVERIDELEDKLNDLEAKLGDTDIEELRKEKTQMKENISQLESLIEDLEQQVRELERERTKIKGELDQISDLKKRIERGERREQWGDNLYDELQQVKTTYEEVKANLRKQNIALLEKHVNNLFDELYQNENYDKIEIGENYEMLLERSTGEIMSPRLTSGGEGAILNLALRAAIYRLVAEKEARAGQLPPFILDEPTDGLDSTHIRELSELIELIRQWDVPQVFLVSHEDELFDAAENEIYVEMDPATETSQTEVRITSGAAPTPVEGDD